MESISDILSGDISDPRLGLVSLTGVELSPDAKFAKVFYTVLGNDSEKKSTEIVLTRAISFIQHQLAEKTVLRYTPHLRFLYDSSMDKGFRIEEKLKNLKDIDEGNSVENNQSDSDD